MSITRVEFYRPVIAASGGRSRTNYLPAEWEGWSVSLEAGAVVFAETASGRSIEVPRSECVIYRTANPKPEKAKP